MRTEEERQPRMISSSPGSDESSELDQCGDDMLDTVDSVVGCVNQNHAELQHQYEEATYRLHPVVRPADQRQPPPQDQQDRSCIGEEALEAVHCGATEPMGDLMLLSSYSSSLATSSEPQQYRPPQHQSPSPVPTNNHHNNNSARSVPFPVAFGSSLYQCQDCSSTKTLRQLQPDVRETIWWPCDRCQRDCRWNPAATATTTTTTTTTGPYNNINWGDGGATTAEDGCVIH
jgi:hypothetical protein